MIKLAEELLHVESPCDKGGNIQMIQVIFSSVKPPVRGFPRQNRALSRALKIEKLKAPLFYRPNGAELQMTGGTRCIAIQTGIFSYRDQLVLKSF